MALRSFEDLLRERFWLDNPDAISDVKKSARSYDGKPIPDFPITPADFSYHPNDLKIEVVDIKYELPDPLIQPRQVASSTYLNGSDIPTYQTMTDSKSTVATASWSLTNTMTFGVGLNAQAGIPGEMSTGVNMSLSLSTAETHSQSTSQTQNWSWNTAIPVAARRRTEAIVTVQEATYNADFVIKLKVKGEPYFRFNNEYVWYDFQIGLQGVFDMHPDPEVRVPRQPYESDPGDPDYERGTVFVTLSGKFLGICGLKYIVKVDNYPLDETLSPNTRLSRTAKQYFNDPKIRLYDSIGPVIGPPDGISYSIVSVTEVAIPTAACGYNDANNPIPGVFNREVRNYTQYVNGSLVATWQETVDTFMRCQEF